MSSRAQELAAETESFYREEREKQRQRWKLQEDFRKVCLHAAGCRCVVLASTVSPGSPSLSFLPSLSLSPSITHPLTHSLTLAHPSLLVSAASVQGVAAQLEEKARLRPSGPEAAVDPDAVPYPVEVCAPPRSRLWCCCCRRVVTIATGDCVAVSHTPHSLIPSLSPTLCRRRCWCCWPCRCLPPPPQKVKDMEADAERRRRMGEVRTEDRELHRSQHRRDKEQQLEYERRLLAAVKAEVRREFSARVKARDPKFVRAELGALARTRQIAEEIDRKMAQL